MNMYCFGNLPMKLLTGKVNIDDNDLKLLLCTNGIVIDQDDSKILTDIDIATYEVTGGNYARKDLTASLSYNEELDKTVLKIDDVTFVDCDFTFRHAIIYSNTNSILIAHIDFEEDQVGDGTDDFVIELDDNGFLSFSVPFSGIYSKSLLADKDTFVSVEFPNSTSFSTYLYLIAQVNYGYGYFILMNFDLSDFIGKQIRKATLKLNVESITLGMAAALGLSIKIIETDWTENTVTYNTKPNITDLVYAEAELADETGLIEIDVKALIQAVADGVDYFGMWIYVVEGTNVQFTCREGENYPALEVEYSD